MDEILDGLDGGLGDEAGLIDDEGEEDGDEKKIPGTPEDEEVEGIEEE